jgi:hypothetical protein
MTLEHVAGGLMFPEDPLWRGVILATRVDYGTS